MKKLMWKMAIFADGLLAFFFVTQFDVDDMVVQYIGAMVCIVTLLFLLAIGWQYVMEYEKGEEDDKVTDIRTYKK